VESYQYDINPVEYLYHPDNEIRYKAIEALGNNPGKENANVLIAYALDGLERDRAIMSLTAMARKSTQIFLYLTDISRERIASETMHGDFDESAEIVIQVILCRLDFFLLKLGDGDDILHEHLISRAMATGKTSDLVSFMNKNYDPVIESALVGLIGKCLTRNPAAMDEIRMYLKESVLQKLNLSPLEIPQKRINEKNESIGRVPLVINLCVVVFVLPIIFFARLSHGSNALVASRAAMNDYLFGFGWYALAANFFYFFLAYLAWREAGKQSRFLGIKDSLFLFRKNLLPSISILAPAYNEEASIVSSVESLLNVNYPEFEVIVVNDGSKDATLSLLISHFKLERTDSVYTSMLRTQPVRAIYANPRIPELRVIDKINGGKADSLNVGLNAARMEYVLGIDSDSILERDALLTLASSFLDEDLPVVASGGNIMPVNGCTVDRGVLREKRIPPQAIPLLQTIEYLRSFMNGRMGWARLDSLMIISGAFGLFRREHVIGINGYLTSREKYERDTVGEDMELVVRLSRSLRERGVRHKILYHYKANCWTEVPSSVKILKRQRERWQRGLIDILSFHRTMIGNPRYGKYGLIGFPYFLAFEVIGPWFELLGTVLFVIGVATGWIDRGVFLFLLASNFILSFALSATALFICDRDGSQFPLRDRIALVLVSLVETLGFRQLMSFFRITGYIGVLRKVTGWGTMTRTGFTGKKGGPS
jgi:cellulose synthase/poly-beta-1,6-N-acetylglucosamine synthase-like glycosyltransferase